MLIPHTPTSTKALKILLAVAAVVALATLGAGCTSDLPEDLCGPVPDGTYVGAAGDSYTFSGGLPAAMECHQAAACPRTLGCSPGTGGAVETVYTVSFARVQGGLDVTTSPPGRTVFLAGP
jgi:hypothetical protein